MSHRAERVRRAAGVPQVAGGLLLMEFVSPWGPSLMPCNDVAV